jgi:cell division GTPase FtsZ
MGIGTGRGKDRAVDAALSAISSPLLGFPISQVQPSWSWLFP